MTLDPLPGYADAVVIGAGAFGLGTGFALAQNGLRNVLVLDQFEPGTQTSARAAGLFKNIQSNETKTKLTKRSIEIIKGFEQETGIAVPYVQPGSLFVARTPEHASMVEAEIEDATGWGVQTERLDRDEAMRRCPYVDSSDFVSAYFIQDDLYIEEPKALLVALMQAGRRVGMEAVGHTAVTGIDVKNSEVRGVQTTRGYVGTPVVVDAAGAWARIVGQMAGVDVKIVPMRHSLRITAPIDGVPADLPIIRITDAAGYARPARGGLMYGIFEPDPLPFGPEPGQTMSLDMVPVSRAVLGEAHDRMKRSMPAIANATAQEERAGLFTMTADGKFIAGPMPGIHGFWVVSGCNGSGFSMSTGLGATIAEWIAGGAPEIDLSLLDPARFLDPEISNADLLAKSIWQYANYYTPLG
ncbi:MAG TPA: FAD-binding oxidoreductase [Thermomicrobiales bacterium]|nr:FAD-binding oxidoreductase [Thermomicrobiales bacterium]